MNYTELKTLVGDYLHRTDLGEKIPTFIALAESFLFRELSIHSLELSVSGLTTGALIALPADCASVGRVTVIHAGRELTLDYSTQADNNYSAGGIPNGYTLEAGGLRFGNAGSGYAYTLYYTPRILPLSDASPTNWLLTNAPDLYSCAAQLEGVKYTQNAELIATKGADLIPLLDSVQRLTKRTGQPQRGSMQIKPRG